jgi:hypothetical protein
MADALIQLGIAAFGLSALWMAMGQSIGQRKWAPIVGLIGQAFWIAFAWQSRAWGIAALVAAYTAVYLRGAFVQWASASSHITGNKQEGSEEK